MREIPIEERTAREVTHVRGRAAAAAASRCRSSRRGSAVANPAFDVTPARLVTGLITERGVAPASREGCCRCFPSGRGAE